MKFLDALCINMDGKWKRFPKEFGIDATENFKLAEDDEWDDHFNSLEWSKMEIRHFKRALEVLKNAGDCNPFVSRPLLIKCATCGTNENDERAIKFKVKWRQENQNDQRDGWRRKHCPNLLLKDK